MNYPYGAVTQALGNTQNILRDIADRKTAEQARRQANELNYAQLGLQAQQMQAQQQVGLAQAQNQMAQQTLANQMDNRRLGIQEGSANAENAWRQSEIDYRTNMARVGTPESFSMETFQKLTGDPKQASAMWGEISKNPKVANIARIPMTFETYNKEIGDILKAVNADPDASLMKQREQALAELHQMAKPFTGNVPINQHTPEFLTIARTALKYGMVPLISTTPSEEGNISYITFGDASQQDVMRINDIAVRTQFPQLIVTKDDTEKQEQWKDNIASALIQGWTLQDATEKYGSQPQADKGFFGTLFGGLANKENQPQQLSPLQSYKQSINQQPSNINMATGYEKGDNPIGLGVKAAKSGIGLAVQGVGKAHDFYVNGEYETLINVNKLGQTPRVAIPLNNPADIRLPAIKVGSYVYDGTTDTNGRLVAKQVVNEGGQKIAKPIPQFSLGNR